MGLRASIILWFAWDSLGKMTHLPESLTKPSGAGSLTRSLSSTLAHPWHSLVVGRNNTGV